MNKCGGIRMPHIENLCCNMCVAEAMRPAVGNTIVLRNVSHASPQTDPRMEHLIKETRKLSELVFDEDHIVEGTS